MAHYLTFTKNEKYSFYYNLYQNLSFFFEKKMDLAWWDFYQEASKNPSITWTKNTNGNILMSKWTKNRSEMGVWARGIKDEEIKDIEDGLKYFQVLCFKKWMQLEAGNILK